jgi:replicative DNA helicase
VKIAGRPPPHDLDAEAAVLSTLLLDVRRRLGQVQLRPADFYSEANGRIYAAIHELAADERSRSTR